MDTATFLKHILPKQGVKFIVLRKGPDTAWLHKYSDFSSQAAENVRQLDGTHHAVYHACATFKEPFIESTTEFHEDGRPKRKYREQSNAGWVKSLWIDLDCGEGKPYPDQKAALADIIRFCKTTGLSRPLLVNSGNGVHCYWVFDEEIDAVRWKRIANLWRCVLDFYNVKHDAQCTTDVSRILRPVGSTNRKKEPRPVKVIGEVPATVDVGEFTGAVIKLIKANGIEITAAPERKKPSTLNSDLGGGMEYPPSSAHEIAKHCAQVRDFRDSGGSVDEPLWYAMLGLLKHTVEADEVCHEWSKGSDKYDAAVTDQKIIQWVQGPTLCTRFATLRPEACEGCKFSQKVKSPIQLGTVVPESVAVVETNTATQQTESLPKIPARMAEKFVWNGSTLSAYVKTDDDTTVAQPFSAMYLYPKQYSRNLANRMDMTWVLRERPGKYKEFELPGEVVGVGGRDLSAHLGRQGVVCTPGGKKYMEQYITEWFNELRSTIDEVDAYMTFGWHKNNFLLGNTLFKPDGSEVRVRVQGDAEKYVEAFEPHGDVQGWVERVDTLYNREGHEQFQWMMGTAFGAPLVKLLGGGMAGCIVNGYSPQSGHGKSTAGMVGLAMYGAPAKLMLAKNQATTKGLFAYIGVMSSLPVLLDEVTNVKGYELSDLVYTFSNGTGRIGAQSDGSLRTNVYGWNTLMATNSNRAIQSTLAATKINATPEINRVYEYKFDRSHNQMSKLEADVLLPELMENCGHVGREYLRYVVQNQAAVKELLAKVRKFLTTKGAMTQEERFWLAGMTTILTGLFIAKKLNLVAFDLAALTDWSIRQVRAMRDLVGETETNPIDQFGVMLNEMSNSFLVTDREGDARGTESKAIVLHSPRGDLLGRVVTATQTLYLPVSVLRKWCSENQADYREMTQELITRQWASLEASPVSLGRGTADYATVPSRCYKINLAAAGGELAAAAAVTHLRSVK